MQQLSFLASEPEKKTSSVVSLFVDGAARNNPGPAGAGIYIEKNGTKVLGEGYFLGNKTNNQAEYIALMLGICRARQFIAKGDSLRIVSDSQLLIRQIIGHYKVKNAALQSLHRKVHELLHGISYKAEHVLREQNTKADAYANEGIDKKRMLTDELISMCALQELL